MKTRSERALLHAGSEPPCFLCVWAAASHAFPALLNNTTGAGNLATGIRALRSNTTASNNIATGSNALYTNTTGSSNVAGGAYSLFNNTTGRSNVATGADALDHNTTGNFNVGLGRNGGADLTTGSNNIDIANPGFAGESGTIRIGSKANQSRAFIAGIYGSSFQGRPVVVSQGGRLGTAPVGALAPQSHTISRLRDKVREQGAELRQQDRIFSRQIQRLRAQMQGLR